MKKEEEMKQKARSGQTTDRLAEWQRRLADCMAQAAEEHCAMERRNALYTGAHTVYHAKKQADNVRNLVFELIESEVDSTIPQPRVTARSPEDTALAGIVEDLLRAQLARLPFAQLNDMDERNTYIQGGDFFQVEWDAGCVTHTAAGDLSVSVRHPRQVLVQPGADSLEHADYVILRAAMTRAAVRRRWGKDVSAEQPEDAAVRGADTAQSAMVTCNLAYYRKEDGHLGRFIFTGDTVLEDDEYFGVRRVWVCADCGAVQTAKSCTGCGGGRFVQKRLEFETLAADIMRQDGSIIPAARQTPAETLLYRPDGTPYLGEVAKTEPTRIPYYLPHGFPLVLRRSVSQFGRLLGASDVDCVADQQETVKKLGSKLGEKVLKGGSFVTLPRGVDIELTDRELKVIRLETPAQKALIDVLTVQPDISRDLSVLRENYEWAKSTLGITDSFQGKADATAVSGTAKQFAAAQASGRLESKRRMKNEAYRRLFRVMFEYLLAYADEPIPVPTVDAEGRAGYATFDRYDFLKQDAAGEWYWNDAFLFDVDSTGGLAQNREAMWAKLDEKFTTGALGSVAEPATLLRYWTLLEQQQFPGAKTVKRMLEKGKTDAVSQMQN